MVIGDHEQAAKVQESEYPMMEQRVYLTAERRRGDSEIAFGSIMQSDILQIKQVEVEQEDHTVHHEFAEGFEAETKEEDVEGGVVQVKQADAVVVVASAVVVDEERTHDQDFEVVDENEEETETEDVRTKMLNRSEKYQTKLVAIRSVDAVQNTDIGGKRHGQKKQKFSLP